MIGKRYRGKNAIWLYVIFIAFNVFPIVLTLNRDFKWNILNMVVIIIVYACNLIWLPILVNNGVDMYDEYFIFHYGFSKEKFYYQDIKKIEKSRNPIASSANSLDRINIVTKEKDFYISLKDNDGFIAQVNILQGGR